MVNPDYVSLRILSQSPANPISDISDVSFLVNHSSSIFMRSLGKSREAIRSRLLASCKSVTSICSTSFSFLHAKVIQSLSPWCMSCVNAVRPWMAFACYVPMAEESQERSGVAQKTSVKCTDRQDAVILSKQPLVVSTAMQQLCRWPIILFYCIRYKTSIASIYGMQPSTIRPFSTATVWYRRTDLTFDPTLLKSHIDPTPIQATQRHIRPY